MRIYRQILIATCLSLSLAGCQTVAPSVVNLSQPQGSQLQTKGSVNLNIRWPEIVRPGYNVNAIPNSAQAIKIEVYQDASQSVKLEEKTLKRSEAAIKMTNDGTDALTSSTMLELAAGAGYTLIARAYNSETTMDESTMVAAGTSDPFSITSGRVAKVKLDLTVPNGPTLDTLAYTAAARGSIVKVTGTNFGTDLTKVKAIYTMTNGGRFICTVDSVNQTGTELSVKLPSDIWNYGAGALKVYVDGISTNEASLAMISDFELDTSSFFTRNENGTTIYTRADSQVNLNLNGWYWNNNSNLHFYSLPKTIEVLDSLNNPVANVVGQDGSLTLPKGQYTLRVKVGDLERTYPWRSVDVLFNAPSISDIKLSNLGINNYPQWTNNISLPGSIDDGVNPVNCTAADFTWTYSVPNIVTRDGATNAYDWVNSQTYARFQTGSTIGSTVVTATLKMDPSKSFSFTIQNVGLQGFEFRPQSADTLISNASLRQDRTLEIQAKIKLSDGTSLDPTTLGCEWYDRFVWSSDNGALLTVAKKPRNSQWDSNQNGWAILTPGQGTGTCSVTVKWSENNSISTTLPVEVTDDGSAVLLID